MESSNQHSTYTAADLLRYAEGRMTPHEMHLLEKAALDDVFLAEALDGYQDRMMQRTSSDQPAEINRELERFKKAIAAKTKDDKKRTGLLPINRWLLLAAAGCTLIGGAWFFYSLQHSSAGEAATQSIAQNEKSALQADTIAAGKFTPQETSKTSVPPQQQQTSLSAQPPAAKVIAAGPGRSEKAKMQQQVSTQEAANDFGLQADSNMLNRTAAADNLAVNKVELKDFPAVPPPVLKSGTNSNALKEKSNEKTYVFNGMLVDENNNPLPYSNIMIPAENIGTYSNARGEFNFLYTDSLLPVKAKSIGYTAQNFVMHPSDKENRLVLTEDQELKNSMVFSRTEKKPRSVNLKPLIIERDSLISAEPSIGWNNYNMYALNNLRLEDLPTLNRTVQLSFEVDAQGSIRNVVVEKSSGKVADEEAIRLLKEGPKWKSKKDAKGRSVLTLKF